MVGVLMRHEHPVQGFRAFSDCSEPFADIPSAQSGIDQNASVAVPDERRIAGAAGSENADLDDGALSGRLNVSISISHEDHEKCF